MYFILSIFSMLSMFFIPYMPYQFTDKNSGDSGGCKAKHYSEIFSPVSGAAAADGLLHHLNSVAHGKELVDRLKEWRIELHGEGSTGCG